MKLPLIENKCIILLKVEESTGIILNNDNSYYLQKGEDYYKLFADIEGARKYVEESAEVGVEYILYDNQGNYLGNGLD